MAKIIVTLFICFLSYLAQAQTIKIFVVDSISKAQIIGGTVYLTQTDQSFTTNESGFVSFESFSKGFTPVKASALGYSSFFGEVNLDSSIIIIRLKPKHLDLHEVSVSSGSAVLQNKNPYHVESRKLSDLNAITSVNLGEIIGKIPGVYSASLGNGISKPVIRGMQGMRVLTLVNGLRLEGQQWGGDHGMGLTSLGISGVEVIKGPATLLYGADALGGVIYLLDAPYVATNSRTIDANFDGFSNTLGGRGQVMLRESYSRFRWLAAVNYSNHADFQLPNGKFAKNSRFNDLGAKVSLSYSGNRSLYTLRYTMSHSVTGIPGHTHDSTATPQTFQVVERARVYELPAQFFQNHLIHLTGQWYRNKSDFNLVFGSTANRLIEFDEKVTIPSLSMLLLNGLIQGKWTYKWNPKTKLMTGFQSMLQQNGNQSNASDTLIPNAMVFDAGVYSSFIAERGNWNFQAGIRYDFRKLMVEFQGEKTIDFYGLNGAMGAVWSNGDFTFRANISSGFRAPHLTELFSNGYHHGALRYELGKIDLKPEKATQLDLTLEWSGDHSAVMLNPFGNFIRDYIFLQPMDTLMDGIPAFSYDQKRQVLFYGLDAGYHFHPHFAHGLHWEISASYIAVWTTGDSSVSLIPQPRLMNTLRYELNLGKKIQVKEMLIQSSLLGAQKQVAYNETATNAYHVLDFAVSFGFGKTENLTVKSGIKNILNTNYIDHLSRLKNIQMPFPGRNFFLGVGYNLTSNLKNKSYEN